jgi:hypothetical protein
MPQSHAVRSHDDLAGAPDGAGQQPMTFKILELKSVDSAPTGEVGHGFSTREEAMVAIKRLLKTFSVSGRNPEGDYWWARDADGLRKYWIANAE